MQPLGLSEIYNFRLVGEQFGTAGQPTEYQFQFIRDAGYQVVINLALPTSDNAVPTEGSIVTGLGMAYVHLPVLFNAPTEGDLRLFCRLLDSFSGKRIFIHCAANKRVSAFVFLYRVLHQGISENEARKDLSAVWQPDPVWAAFIQEQLGHRAS